MSEKWIHWKATLSCPEWVGIQSLIRHLLSPDCGCAEPCRSTKLHTEQLLPCGSPSLHGETGTQMNAFQFIRSVTPWQRCGDCVGSGRGTSQRRCLWAVPWRMGKDCRVEKGGSGKAIQAGCQLLSREITWMCLETHPFGYGRFRFFSSLLPDSSRIPRVGRGGWRKREEVGVSWASLQNFL